MLSSNKKKGRKEMYIKQIASQYDISSETIRYYEKIGLITPERSENGYRLYTDKNERELKYIIVLKQLGFSLQEISELFILDRTQPSEDCKMKSEQLIGVKVDSVEAKLHFLTVALEALKEIRFMIKEGNFKENQRNLDQVIHHVYEQMKIGGVENE